MTKQRSPEAFTDDLKETLKHIKELDEEAGRLGLTVAFETQVFFEVPGYPAYNKRVYLNELGKLKITTVRKSTEYYKDTD